MGCNHVMARCFGDGYLDGGRCCREIRLELMAAWRSSSLPNQTRDCVCLRQRMAADHIRKLVGSQTSMCFLR